MPNEFTTYDFMCLYCAIYANEKINFFNYHNLLNYINYCKTNNLFPNLLEDITIKTFTEAIQKLRSARILYTISPDEIIYLFSDTPISKLINKRENYLEDMLNFITNYHIYLTSLKKQLKN